MENYMEKQLYKLHTSGSKSNFKQKFLSFSIAILFIFLLPYLHIGVFYRKIWVPDKPPINRDSCECGCFDTIFRGRYENPPSAYKHLYFNATSNMLWMWLILLLGVLGLHEAVKYLVTLVWEHRVRWSMLAVALSSLYPHYYGWWGLLNYLNEEYYPQWYHQLFFSITEVASSMMVLHLCNKSAKMNASKLLFVIVINLQHIVIASLDQFILNIIAREGKGFEAVRDFALMLPDVFHVLLPFFELQDISSRKRVSWFQLFYKEEFMLSGLVLVLLTLLVKNI